MIRARRRDIQGPGGPFRQADRGDGYWTRPAFTIRELRAKRLVETMPFGFGAVFLLQQSMGVYKGKISTRKAFVPPLSQNECHV